MREQALLRIGNGVRAVVQVHGLRCPRCVASQREVRDAPCNLDEPGLRFLVANNRSAEGEQLAAAHGIGHVILLLFDAFGQKTDQFRI
jgi:hypothetical protein